MEITKQERTAVLYCVICGSSEMVTAEGIDTYLTYSTSPPNPFMPLHLTHTMRSRASTHYAYTTILSDSAINVSQTAADM